MISAKSFIEKFLKDEFQVVAFYPYTSSVTVRLVSQSSDYPSEIDEELNDFFEKYMKKAEELGANRDNKVVIELRPIRAFVRKEDFNKINSFFVGKYDNRISIGLGVYQESLYSKWNLYLNNKNNKLELKLK